MKTPIMSDVDRPAVHSLVSSYFMARAYAEVMREKVDAIHLEILTESPIYADKRDGGDKITKSKDLYLATDEAACADFYAEANNRLRSAGLKPDDMADEYCPALVAEHLLTDVERALIDESGKAFGIDSNKLLNAGLESYHKFIDLVCKFIANLPHYKAPKLAA